MIANPCEKTCPERHPRCHENCAAYKLWRAEQDGRLRKRRNEAQAEGMIIDGINRRKEPFIRKNIK